MIQNARHLKPFTFIKMKGADVLDFKTAADDCLKKKFVDQEKRNVSFRSVTVSPMVKARKET